MPLTLASDSSGSSGLVHAKLALPLRSLVLMSSGEPPWDEVSDSFCKAEAVAHIVPTMSAAVAPVPTPLLTTPLMPLRRGCLGTTMR